MDVVATIKREGSGRRAADRSWFLSMPGVTGNFDKLRQAKEYAEGKGATEIKVVK